MEVYNSKECESATTDDPKKAVTREKGGIFKKQYLQMSLDITKLQ